MKRIVVSNIVSLDGYFEGPSMGVMDLNMDTFFDAHNLECFEAADTVLLGAASYTGFSGYWPFVENHPELAADDPMARAYDETNRAISRNWNSKPIVVVSHSYQVPTMGRGPPTPPSSAVTRLRGGNRTAQRRRSSSLPVTSCGTVCSRRAWSTSCT